MGRWGDKILFIAPIGVKTIDWAADKTVNDFKKLKIMESYNEGTVFNVISL